MFQSMVQDTVQVLTCNSCSNMMFPSLFPVYNIVYNAENMFFADNFKEVKFSQENAVFHCC